MDDESAHETSPLLARADGGVRLDVEEASVSQRIIAKNRPERIVHEDSGAVVEGDAPGGQGPAAAPEAAPAEACEKEIVPSVNFFEYLRFADWKDWLMITIGTLSAVTSGALLPVVMLVFGNMMDDFINFEVTHDGDRLMDAAKKFVLYYAMLAEAAFVLGYLYNSMWMWAGERQTQRIRRRYFEALMRQNIGWYDSAKSGELTTRIASDPLKIQDGFSEKLGQVFQYAGSFFAGFVIAFTKGWKLTLVLCGILPLLGVCGGFLGKLMTSMSTRGQAAYADAGAVAEEVIGSIRTVAAFSGEERELKRYTANLSQAFRTGVKKGFVAGMGVGTTFLILFCGYALAFWYGGRLYKAGEMTGGQVMTVFFSVIIGAFAIGQATPNVTALLEGMASAGYVYRTIDRVPEIDSLNSAGLQPESVQGQISFKDVEFQYPTRPDVPVLQGLSLDIQPGQTVALVGSSGCGKSTIVSLLLRFYDPAAGEVSLDGHALGDLNLAWLRSQIGYVGQEPVLFDTTIYDNIALGNKGATREEIVEAAQAANAHQFISALPDGYDTLVGQRGAQLSGGQKQRIAIARALVKRPRILLADEMTSALDAASEKVVQDALDVARQGRTTIVIAHRLSTIVNADVVVAIDQGRIVEKGTHSELMAKNGLYAGLVRNQQFATPASEGEVGVPHDSRQAAPRRKSTGGARKASLTGRGEEQPLLQDDSPDDVAIDVGGPEDAPLPDIPISRVARYNRKEIHWIALGLVGAILNGVSMPMFSIIFSQIANTFTKTGSAFDHASDKWSLCFVGLGVLILLANLFQIFFFSLAGEKMTFRLRKICFRAILAQDVSWFDFKGNSTGTLTTKLASDASLVQGMLGARMGSILQMTVNMVAGIVIAFISGWQLTLVILACVPLVAISGAIHMNKLKGFSEETRKAYEESGNVSAEAVENMRTVASLGAERHFLGKYSHCLEEPFAIGVRKAQFFGIGFGLSQMFMFGTYAVGFYFGAYFMKEGYMDYLHMIRTFTAIVFCAMAMGQASSFAPDYHKARDATNNIFKLIDSTPAPEPRATTVPAACNGEVVFKDVRFSYPTRPAVAVLDGLDLSVQPGQTLALVGQSGCGKSTTVSLLQRFYKELASGRIELDGTEIDTMDLRWLRGQMGLVSQEPVLFSTTIMDNILYGKPNASHDEVMAAARAANIHDFIMSLPQQYATMVGERGAQLSGGQKQRVAIARALIRNPPILLLDEATSALDTESEALVQQALDRAARGRTTIVIAHRLSTVSGADKLAVFSKGRVVECGTHTTLLERNGVYANLVRHQMH